MPLHLKQTFPPILLIFTEGDGIKSRLPFKIFSTLQETWRELELLLDQEKIRSVGVSNFQVSDLEDLIDSMETSDTLPHVNQCEFHPCQNPEELVKFCLKNQIQVGILLFMSLPFSSVRTLVQSVLGAIQ